LLIINKVGIIITYLSQKEGNKLKNLWRRVKSQKGMSGVLVALLLVIVGVGLVAGVNTFMTGASTTIQTSANTAITAATQ
jgi:Flp pilus assembly pilin Flp